MSKIGIAFFALCLTRSLAAADPVTNTSNTTYATNSAAVSGEQIRTACIEGRRTICGRVLQVSKTNLVVESGYTTLTQPPLNHSWVTRSNVNPPKTPNLVEGKAPDSIAVGLVFVVDFPKRPAVHQYDYVCLHGYPAGSEVYKPMPGIEKTLRKFSGGLETAVRLNLQSGEH